jgi:hypothetical protein
VRFGDRCVVFTADTWDGVDRITSIATRGRRIEDANDDEKRRCTDLDVGLARLGLSRHRFRGPT